MALDVLGWFVLAFVVLGLIKFLFLLFNAKAWMKFAFKLYSKPALLVIIELILALILFYYLLQSFTIVQIMAGVLLGALLTGMTFAAYGKETIAWAKKIMNTKSLLKKAWLPMLLWLILMVWALIELF